MTVWKQIIWVSFEVRSRCHGRSIWELFPRYR